jgi:hypothetical protein
MRDRDEVEINSQGKVTSVEIHIQSIYRSAKGANVNLTELELFGEKK